VSKDVRDAYELLLAIDQGDVHAIRAARPEVLELVERAGSNARNKRREHGDKCVSRREFGCECEKRLTVRAI
jgi:hypothetical protein